MAAKSTDQATKPLAPNPPQPQPDTLDPSATLWRGNRASPIAVVHLVRGNLRHGWRLLLAAGLGILVAVVLLCTVPLYSTLVGNVQLQSVLNARGPAGRNVEIVVADNDHAFFNPYGKPTGTPQDALVALQNKTQQEDALVRQIGQSRLGAFTAPDVTTASVTATLPFALINDQPAVLSPNQAQAQLLAYDYTQAGPHMSLLAGHFPQPLPAGSTDPPDALITLAMAQQRNVHVGDTLSVGVPGGSQLVAVRVAGVWQPNQLDDNFWNGRNFATVPIDLANGQLFIYPILLDQPSLQAIAANAPSLGTERHWIFYADPTRITSATMSTVADQVIQFEHDINNQLPYLTAEAAPPQVHIFTQLDATLRSVVAQLALITQPLFAVAIQLEGLALLFVGAMAGLLVEAQALEIATLRSRGASGWQVLGGYALQGSVLGIAAALAGPWLAALVAVALVRSFVPAAALDATGVSSGFLTGLARPSAVIVPALVGAALGVGAVLVATWQAARMDVLAFRREQGRANHQPFWRRFYLDIALAVICVLAYVDLSLFGGLGARTELGQTASSPLLFAAPALLLLAGGLLVLRAFPVAAGLGARL
ncbi:MAG TPA: hypothetical protein VGN32_13975, partial [Ktedonobacterales bacterium]|nr:hypothetical protein [Ktedonobacterales bacterium]